MDNHLPISLVMSSVDYDRWVNDNDTFIRVFVHDNNLVTYSMTTYDNLWKEAQYCLSDDARIILDQLEGDAYDNFKDELFSDFIMRTDAYSYNDYINSDSFVPYIWINQIGFQFFYVLIFGDYRDSESMNDVA